MFLPGIGALSCAQQTGSTPEPDKRVASTLVHVAEHTFCLEPILEKQTAAERAQITARNAVKSSAFSIGELASLCPVILPAAHKLNELALKLRFVNGPKVTQLTPAQKAKLAAHNLFDPFNLLTLSGLSAISTAADSHSPYGPGFNGFGKNLGVNFTEDMTGEFFNTFLVPSIFHQDPHYHRLPNASVKRRILHTAIAVLWASGDNGRGMPNYSNLVGGAIDDEIANLYVPGRETNLRASAERYGVNLATAPADNLVTEFLPDIARRIHIHDVFIQRIINTVAKSNQ